MAWKRHKLRDAEVWARVGTDGALVLDQSGRVDVVYKSTAGAKVYRAAGRNLVPLGGEAIEIDVGEAALDSTARGANAGARPAPTGEPIHVWTDGACRYNPGPAGIGVVIIDGTTRREISQYLGEGTNNIAELTAIERGLQSVADKTRPVIVYSDSAYAIGLLTKPWKPKANVELVARLRALARELPHLRFVKVAGHSGIAENERVDRLAVEAVESRSDTDHTTTFTPRGAPTSPPRPA
jgi:ribonuclease HI